ncbi:MAG: LysR family transcriptional regulator [Thermoleophilia bacterium]|nr:LysR family transcriptional regulator [Thermoleophilia bacterium]
MESDSWLGVELRHFAALQAVASEGSFGRAAERLGYTQSAISQQIQTLERIVGEKLIERPGGPRPVSLTEAGRLLLSHADSIVARLQAAQADLQALRSGEAGVLRVGTFQSAGARLLPEIMRRFRDQWPQIEVMLEERDSDAELATMVERGELDVAFVLPPFGDAPLETIELLRDPYVLVVARNSELAQVKSPPTLARIADEPLIGFRACRSMDPFESALSAAGCEPKFAFRTDDNGTVQGLIAAGIGSAVMPRLTVDASDPRITVIELGNRVPSRVIHIARHRDRYHSPSARAFVETALDVTAADQLAA